jgi:hypothetical protein
MMHIITTDNDDENIDQLGSGSREGGRPGVKKQSKLTVSRQPIALRLSNIGPNNVSRLGSAHADALVGPWCVLSLTGDLSMDHVLKEGRGVQLVNSWEAS